MLKRRATAKLQFQAKKANKPKGNLKTKQMNAAEPK